MLDRWIVPTLLLGALVSLLLLASPFVSVQGALAQDESEASTCEDLCYDAEDRCFDRCEDAEDASACEDRCIDESRTCIQACE